MDSTAWQIVLLFSVLAVVAVTQGRKLLRNWQRFRAWEAAGKPTASSICHCQDMVPKDLKHEKSVEPIRPHSLPDAPIAIDYASIPVKIVPGAATALASPPNNLWYAIEFIKRHYAKDYGRFTFPLGWWCTEQNQPMLSVAHFVNDVNCALVTAIQGGGKDNTILNMLFTLMMMYPPEKLQIAIIDGKGGLDYIGWDQKAHVWHVARHPHDLREAMDLITAERMRRVEKLYSAGKSKWDNYTGDDMPMLIVLFSEIKALQTVMKRSEIESVLDSELSVWRGLGMRMLVCTQNSSNWSKEWRAAFEFFIAGTQPSRDEDKPNTGKDPKDLEAMGVIPPSKLPSVGAAPGVMTVVHGNDGVTLRTSHINDEQRAYWLNLVPNHTPESQHRIARQKAVLLRDLDLLRQTIEGKTGNRASSLEGVAAHSQKEPLAQDLRDWDLEPVASEEQPVIALAKAADSVPEYDAPVLANVLATTKLKDLPQHPVFVAACKVAYQKRQTYMGVAREFWGTTTGSREMAIKEALGHKEPVRAELASAA